MDANPTYQIPVRIRVMQHCKSGRKFYINGSSIPRLFHGHSRDSLPRKHYEGEMQLRAH